MSLITSESAGAWQALANSLDATRPSVGRVVTVVKGTKHKDKTGVVVRHMLDKFYSTRYESEAQAHMRQMRGTRGYRIKIAVKCEASGSLLESFWVPATYVEVKPL